MHFVGEVPASEIPDVMAGSDISLVVLARKDLFLSVIPSKMFEAMAAGKPVVMGVAGEAAAILEAAQAGVCVEPENVDELVKAIQRLADSPALRTEMGEQGREFVTRHFDRSRLARAYGVFLEHVAGKAPRGVESGVEQMVPVGGDTSLWHPREPSGVEPSQ
jgi:glycosyltransferase involved in cell wall biosynthesis